MKLCGKCGLDKPDTEFRVIKRPRYMALRSDCRSCETAYIKSAEYRAKSKAKNAKYRAAGLLRDRDQRHHASYQKRHPGYHKATNAVRRAERHSTLTRPKQCDECREEPPPMRDGRSAIQAHHDDYTKPLDVRWLCHACHVAWHRKAEGTAA